MMQKGRKRQAGYLAWNSSHSSLADVVSALASTKLAEMPRTLFGLSSF